MCLSIVLHADDFGLNAAVTAGILRGFTHGLLTSTSVLANAPHAQAAIVAWRDFARRGIERGFPSFDLRRELDEPGRAFDLGVHLNLTQGRPLTGERYPAALLNSDGCFPGVFGLYARLRRPGSTQFSAALRNELAAQIAWPVDHGIRPTHLNGHQYIELLPQVAQLLPALLAQFAIPTVRMAVEPALARTTLGHGLRVQSWFLAKMKAYYARRLAAGPVAQAATAPQAYFGTAHAGLIDAQVMDMFLVAAGSDGLIEIGIHPGLKDYGVRPEDIRAGWEDPLAAHRPRELALLESPQLAARLRAKRARLGRLAQLDRAVRQRAA